MVAPLLALGAWGALALVGAARDDTDDDDPAMDPYGSCLDFDDGEGGICSDHAQDDSQHPPDRRLGADCPTGCSSYNSLTKATHCCSKGCCLCGGPGLSLYTSGTNGSGSLFPDKKKNEKPFDLNKYDIFGVCTGNVKSDERPEHPHAEALRQLPDQERLARWKQWSFNDQQQYRCPDGCVAQGKFPAIIGEAFEGKACTLCDFAANQVWKLAVANQSAGQDACEYLGKRWDETCKESPETPDGLTCANQTLTDLLGPLIPTIDIPQVLDTLCALPVGRPPWCGQGKGHPVWTGPIAPWASTSYFLRLGCAGASEPWLDYSWGKGLKTVLAELPKELGKNSTGHYPIGTKNCPSFDNCSADLKSAWSGGWRELQKSCKNVQTATFHETYDSKIIDTCDLAVRQLCPRGDGTGKPGTYPTAEKCQACVSKRHLGENSDRWLLLKAMCGSAAGYVTHTVEYQAILSCQRDDQSDDRINKVCCKSNCCKRAPPPPPPKQWYELWTTWVMIGLGALVLCFSTLYYRKYRRRDKAPSVLRQSLLGYAVYAALGAAVVVQRWTVVIFAVKVTASDVKVAVAVSVTWASLGLLPSIVGRFREDLRAVGAQPEISLSRRNDATGWFGLLKFMWGVADIVQDVALCVSLAQSSSWWLFSCAATSSLVTTSTSLYLGYHLFKAAALHNDDCRDWTREHGPLVAIVYLLSVSRLESLAILRLRLCESEVWMMPMERKYFHFVRQSGLVHYVLEDVPHMAVSIADPQLTSWVWWMTVIFSGASILYGLADKAVQLMLLRLPDGGTSMRETLFLAFDGSEDSDRKVQRVKQLITQLDEAERTEVQRFLSEYRPQIGGSE